MTADEFAAKPAHMSERKVLDRYTGYVDWRLKDAELLARIDHMPVLEGLQEWRKVHPEDFSDLFDEDNQPPCWCADPVSVEPTCFQRSI